MEFLCRFYRVLIPWRCSTDALILNFRLKLRSEFGNEPVQVS